MDFTTHEGTRWKVVYGNYTDLEKLAVEEVYKVVQQFVPYVLTTLESSAVNEDDLTENNIILIGTSESNQLISKLIMNETIKHETKKEGFSITTGRSVYNSGMNMIVLAGADDAGTLYSVYDFEHYFVDPHKFSSPSLSLHHSDLFNPFYNEKNELFEYSAISAPAVENRGFWTWGHVIYDFKKYLENMCRWKLNTIIIWNDFAPLNAAEIVEYAHNRNIKVIWGFGWSWGEDVNPTMKADQEEWVDKVIDIYEKQYKKLNIDGIYFQAFTETANDAFHGENIAKLAVDWVNFIGGKLLEKYPELWLQFGLHGLSKAIRDGLEYVACLDKRINISWEDCGSFPYRYDPSNIEDFEETADFTKKISGLRGCEEDFGMVLKGMVCLKWNHFEHQKGTFILGNATKQYIDERTNERKIFWKHVQASWIKNIRYLVNIIRIAADADNKRSTITGLVEDGLWEEKMWYPAALFAETLWNPNQSPDEILSKVADCNDVYFA